MVFRILSNRLTLIMLVNNDLTNQSAKTSKLIYIQYTQLGPRHINYGIPILYFYKPLILFVDILHAECH